MSVLEITNLKFGYKGETLFNEANLRLLKDDHMGLVGLNGAGKSTLMNLIAYRLLPDEGKIIWDNNIEFSYLDQHLKIYDDQTISEYLYNVYEPLFFKEKEMNDLYVSLETAPESDYDKILNKAYNIQNYLEESNFYMIKSKISNVINGLGIDDKPNRILKNLSSGQRGKVFLAKMLLEEKDVLLLDEPTNFLDVAHVEWLSKFLVNYKNPFIVISHDSNFLNKVCNVIYCLENKQLTRYKGNYEDFLKLKELHDKEYMDKYIAQTKYIKKTQDFIDKNIVRATTSKRAQSRQKQLDKIVKIEKPTVTKSIFFNFPFSNSFNSKALEVTKLEIGYNKVLLPPINLNVEFGEKIVIVGDNGVGKSTFIKTILGKIPSLSGKVKMPFYNIPLYFEQEYYGDKLINSIEYFKEKYPLMEDKKIRDILGRYGIIGELSTKRLNDLSGGELTKVRFARLSLEYSNMLILDEPTNHLDINAKDALFKAINEYPGTVLLVSHEKEFYKKMNMKEVYFG